MDIMAVLRPLLAEPMALVMALLTVVCLIAAVGVSRFRDRVFTVVLASISGVTAWMMATRWRW